MVYSFAEYLRIRIQSLLFVIILLTPVSLISGKDNPHKNDPMLLMKKMGAAKVDEAPRIDGFLDDEIWQRSELASDFIQYSPVNGEKSKYRTEVRVLYDNDALYIGAMMYDPNPDSIFTELGPRDSDNELNADRFSIDISPYNDGINGAQFKVSASGVQTDRPPRSGGDHREGDTWDAVWESKTRITEEGWIVEMRIPYSALRFSRENEQTWGINFWREVRRTRELSSWNYVDREIGSSFNHLGELTGIRDIEPPLRLSVNPYLSAYLERYDSEKPKTSFNGGLDLKYGINESFTLDATLVPDFGQIRSDDQVLNLSPYEVKYNENRPFFMEGTELFNKGGIFYSRRIGSRPQDFYNVYDRTAENEEIRYNPSEAALINATKLSGRTRGGLGIGVFNAMTRAMYAIVKDTITGNTREDMTGPFTNYSMLVIDQSLRNNSYISLVNTNVWRNAEKDEIFYTANVTGTDFRFQNSNRQYSISGQAAISQKYFSNNDSEFGHMFEIRAGKTGGQFRVQYNLEGSTGTYDPNDMGYLRRNNELTNQVDVSYNIYQPFWRILTQRTSLQYNYSMLFKPNVFTGSAIELSTNTTFRNYVSFMLRGEYKPLGEDDYYEPRIDGWFYHRPEEANIMTWFSTNYNKRVSANIRINYTNIWSDFENFEYSVSMGPNFKFSDRFSLGYNFQLSRRVNDIGYASSDDELDEVYFGRRNNSTVENRIESSFIFNSESYLSLRLRHYWSRADYLDDYFILKPDGSLESIAYSDNHDYNYNAFNIDMVYTWRFAPGSELSLVWKHSIYSDSETIYYDFRENLKGMFESDKMNSISLKILYYLDYQNLRRRK